MQGRVEDLDDLAADLNRVRDVDDVPEETGDAGRERRLAVARRAEQQHGAAGADRRQELADVVLGHHQPLEALAHRLGVEQLVRYPLAGDLALIGGERDRRGAEILADLQRLLGLGAALLAQREADRQGEAAGRAERLHKAQLRRLVHQLLHEQAGELHALGEFEDGFDSLDVHELDHQIEEAARRDAGLAQPGRGSRCAVDHRFELLAGDVAERDQIFAESPARNALAVRRRFDLGVGNQTAPHQYFAQPHDKYLCRVPASAESRGNSMDKSITRRGGRRRYALTISTCGMPSSS